jgi:hypothetical protein
MAMHDKFYVTTCAVLIILIACYLCFACYFLFQLFAIPQAWVEQQVLICQQYKTLQELSHSPLYI